ncbi:hypothetical protein COB55_05645 [Candidatus Wolfebacteria bacterium]|nr:MAG: hypothetical protein COB55_05645 [Candidatus Wolfebacteria bacterium]
MAEKQQSVYQSLSRLFGTGGQPEIQKKNTISAKELLTATSHEELLVKRLQAQQSEYLDNQFEKLTSNLYQQSVYYETTRLASYGDFEAMEFSIVGNTKIATPDGFITIKELADKGIENEFVVYSYDHNLKRLVSAKARNAHYTRDEMTYKIIFDDSSRIIATHGHRFLKRNGTYCKVEDLEEGDSMMPFYETDDKIYSCNDDIGWINKEFFEYNIEKCDLNNKINIYWDDFISELESLYKKYNNSELKWSEQFIDVQLSKKFNVNVFDLECFIKQNGYDSWEILLESYNISTQNLELEPEFNHKIKSIEPYKVVPVYDLTVPGYKNFATDTIISHNTPEISASLDLFSEESCLVGNTRIKLLNGNNPTIEELYNRNEKNFWVYSYDTNDNKFIPAKSEKVIYKGIQDVYLIKLDDDTEIKSTGNHKWLGKNNIYIETDKLVQGNSLTNHRVVSVEYIGKEKVYDIVNSGEFNSFGVKCNNGMILSHNCTLDEFGKMFKVFSNSKRIKNVLENLFYNVMDIDINLPSWVRNTPIRENSIIPLLDGTEITIKELAKRIKENPTKDIWTYSIQDDTHKLIPGKIIWCDLTRKDSEILKITLDDGTYVETTPDHEFLLRDGVTVRADKLNSGDSLMPFYTRTSIESKNKIKGYELVYNPSSNRHRFTHRIVAYECLTDFKYENKINDKFLTHHINFFKLNNDPSNLKRMSFSEHAILHEENSKIFEKYRNRPDVVEKRMKGIDKWLRSDERRERMSEEMMGIYPEYFKDYNHSDLHTEHNEIRSNTMKKLWSDEDYKNDTKSKMRLKLNDDCFEYICKIVKNKNSYITSKELSELLKKDDVFVTLFKESNNHLNKNISKTISSKTFWTTLNRLIKRKTNLMYCDFLISILPQIVHDPRIKSVIGSSYSRNKKVLTNHKVVSVEKILEKSDVYCMEVVGPNGEGDRHNFPICSKDNDGNHTRNGVFVSNCKYGDNFIYLKSEVDKGITGVKQLPNIEIRREESSITDQKNVVRFIWQGRDMEFTSWQMGHFRLLGDDRKLPYGTSILEKARKIWKQLVLSEDAMLVYRLTRAPERKVFNIDVGNIDDKDIESYINRVSQKFKRTQQAENTGNFTSQVDVRYNTLPIHKDTPIPLLDGRTLTIEELSKEYVSGINNEVYSIKDGSYKVVPGKVIWCGKNYTANKLIKVWLDDDTWVMTAPEHPFILKNGKSVMADKLETGYSLMPFYTEVSEGRNNFMNGYEKTYNPYSGKYEYTHRIIGNQIIKENEDYNTIHHKNFKKRNNCTDNLQWVDFHEHKKMHSDLTKKNWASGIMDEVGKKVSEKLLKKWSSGEFEELRSFLSEDMKRKWEEGVYDGISKKVTETMKKKWINGDYDHLLEDMSKRFIEWNKSDEKRELTRQYCIENNTADNFKWYNGSDLHKEHNEIRRNVQLRDWSTPGKKEERSEKMKVKFDDLIWSRLRICILNKEIISQNNARDYINSNLIEHLISVNSNKRLERLKRISKVLVRDRVVDLGFNDFADYKSSILTNHKVLRTEEIYEPSDVYCMTVVGPNNEDDRHNFAVCSVDNDGNYTRNGVFVKNSVDVDYFLPQRAGGGVNSIETLPGASNLAEIADIEYIQRKLFTAMRVPKSFLGFEDAIGEGKNLAIQDIRFARTINRIQQSMIQELNKIAIIHLFMLGFEEDLDNFTLTLNSPSTQAEMLKVEQWKEKVLLYRDLVSDAGNGHAACSMSWSKKNILGFSDDEIMLDLKQQRIEKALASENEAPQQVIHTGIFDNLDKRYKKSDEDQAPEAEESGGQGELPGIGGELGDEDMGDIPDLGGEEGGELPGLQEGEKQILEESRYKILRGDSTTLNEDVDSMIKSIDKLIKSGEKIVIKKTKKEENSS